MRGGCGSNEDQRKLPSRVLGTVDTVRNMEGLNLCYKGSSGPWPCARAEPLSPAPPLSEASPGVAWPASVHCSRLAKGPGAGQAGAGRSGQRSGRSPFSVVCALSNWAWAHSSCKRPLPGPETESYWEESGWRWPPRSDTRTIRSGSRRFARTPRARRANRRRAAPGRSPRRETRGTGWRTRSPSSAEGTCSALSCASSGSWGACRTCHSLSLCSCTVCRWCARESASSCHCCWRSVCHSPRIHI